VSYLVPAMRSREARHRALNGQFQFTCRCVLCSTPFLEDGPAEEAAKLEADLEHVEEHELMRRPQLALTHVTEARKVAVNGGLGKRHISLARADILLTESCLALLDDDKPASGKAAAPNPADLVFQLLASSISIRQTQVMLFEEGMSPARLVPWVDTRSEAEPTLQHLSSGIGYFVGLGKKGAERLLSLVDDDNRPLFASVNDAIRCQLRCDKVAAQIANLYE